MGKLYLLFGCAALAFLAISTSVDAAAVEEFEEGPEPVLSSELDENIYEPEEDSADDLEPDHLDDELPEEFDDVDDPEVDDSEVSDTQGFHPWHTHYHHNYHYHYDDHHHHYHYDHHHKHDHEGTCECSGDTCDCCATSHNFHVTVDGRDFILSACVNVTYLNKKDKYDVSVSINEHDLLTKRTCSLDHLSPLCYKVPGFKRVTSCVEFHDVSDKHACVELNGKVKLAFFHTSLDLQLGCFTIPGK